MTADSASQKTKDIILLCELRKQTGLRCKTCIYYNDLKKVCIHEDRIAKYYEKYGRKP